MAKCEVCQKDMFFGRKIRITRSLNVCTRCLRSGKVERA